MKLTERKLRKIIREEVRTLNEKRTKYLSNRSTAYYEPDNFTRAEVHLIKRHDHMVEDGTSVLPEVYDNQAVWEDYGDWGSEIHEITKFRDKKTNEKFYQLKSEYVEFDQDFDYLDRDKANAYPTEYVQHSNRFMTSEDIDELKHLLYEF